MGAGKGKVVTIGKNKHFQKMSLGVKDSKIPSIEEFTKAAKLGEGISISNGKANVMGKEFTLDSFIRGVASLGENEYEGELGELALGDLLNGLTSLGVDVVTMNIDTEDSLNKRKVKGNNVADVVNNVTRQTVYPTYTALVDDYNVNPRIALELISNKLSNNIQGLNEDEEKFKNDLNYAKGKVNQLDSRTYITGNKMTAKDIHTAKGKNGLEPSITQFTDIVKSLSKTPELDINSFVPINDTELNNFLSKATYTVYSNDKIIGKYYYSEQDKDSIKATVDASYNILQALDDLRPKNKDTKRSPKKTIHLQPSRTQRGLQAYYTPASRSFTLTDSNIGTPIFGDEITTGYNSGYKGLGSTLIHEYGHYIDHVLRNTDKQRRNSFREKTKNMSAVSRYGNSNKEEAFAEAFVCYCTGCDYPHVAESYMQEFRQFMKDTGLTSYENSFKPGAKLKSKPKVKVVDKKVSEKETKKIVDDIFKTTPIEEPKPEPVKPKKPKKPEKPKEEPKPADRMTTLIAKYSKYKTTSTLTKDFKAGKISQAEYNHILNALGKNTKTVKEPTPVKKTPTKKQPTKTETKVKEETKSSVVPPTKEQKKPTTSKTTKKKNKQRVENTYSDMSVDDFNNAIDDLLNKYK